jgi:hypothetical protein
MFGLTNKLCDDANLFGYLMQAIGGAYNKAIDFHGGRVSSDQIIDLVRIMLGQRGMKITSAQENTIIFAAQIVAEFCNLDASSEIKSSASRFARMMGNFDFSDPSVNAFRVNIAKFGCVFNF